MKKTLNNTNAAEAKSNVNVGHLMKNEIQTIKNKNKMINLTFSQALVNLKKGRKIARIGWNGKNMWLRYVDLYTDKQFSVIEHEGAQGTLKPWIGMKTADNGFVPWLASQPDILSDDWVIVEEQ